MRQIFYYKPNNGVLLQSRLYNDAGGVNRETAESKIYRDLIQREISDLEGAANLWRTFKYYGNDKIELTAGNGFGGYPDWEYGEFNAKISIRADHESKGIRGNPNVTVVNEPGLYSVILRSNKPEAKAFKRWITHDVLPAIRQTGHYGMTEPSAEAGLQRIGLIIRAAEHKAVPQSEQLRLLKLAVRDLTGTELATQKTQALGIMDLPEVYGVIKKGKVKKFGQGKGSVQLYSLLELADELGVSPSEFNDFADRHNLKSSYMGEWVRVGTAQGEAREFIYTHGVIDGYFEGVR